MLNRYIIPDRSTILITGVAGFIGFHLAERLSKILPNVRIVGIDIVSITDDSLPGSRLSLLSEFKNFTYKVVDITNEDAISSLFVSYSPNIVFNLAGITELERSLKGFKRCFRVNVEGFLTVLDACRRFNVFHLIYASSGDVYGNTKCIPFRVLDNTDSPLDFLAASKKSQELMAYVFSSSSDLLLTGLRIFSVYGPFGNQNDDYFKYTDKLLRGDKIELSNEGKTKRDLTYISDVIDGLVGSLFYIPTSFKGVSRVYNIGSANPIPDLKLVQMLFDELVHQRLLKLSFNLSDFLEETTDKLGFSTFSDNSLSERDLNYYPRITMREGIYGFIHWYKHYYSIQ